MRNFVSLAAAFAIAGGFSLTSTVEPARAATVTFEFDREFSGATAPEGVTPWLTATFNDIVGGISLVIEATNLTDAEYVSKFFFNTNDIAVSVQAGSPTGDAPAASFELNPSESGDGAGNFDVLLDYPPPGADRFTDGLISSWVFLGTLTTADILSLSDHNSNPEFIAAHIQSIGGEDADSGWITGDPHVIPLPAGLVLFLSGLAGVGFLGRYKARRRETAAA